MNARYIVSTSSPHRGVCVWMFGRVRTEGGKGGHLSSSSLLCKLLKTGSDGLSPKQLAVLISCFLSLIQTWDNGICLGQDTELAVPDLHVSPVLTSLYMEPLVPLLPQQHLVQKVLQESKVLPDQIHTPDVMPTKRHIKYFNIKTA